MFSLGLLAGRPIRLTATTRAGCAAIHRWQARMLPAGVDEAPGAAAHLSYGSEIGGADRVQHIEIPAQQLDCRLEVAVYRRDGIGWLEERAAAPLADTPDLLELGFGAAQSAAEPDVLLSFRFRRDMRT